MEEIESYDITLFIKQLKLSVKFPCRLTLQQAGRVITPEIQSNGTNLFSVNREVNVKEEKVKDYLQININLATDKGGNIMAGIIKINLKDIASSQGQNLTISLQKCLDPYATCLLTVKTVKLNRSLVRRGTMGDEKKQKYTNDNNKFETKSEVMALDPSKNNKQKVRFNEAETYNQKRANLNNYQSPVVTNSLKQKALSTVGFKGVNTSFEKELATRFKHLNQRDDQDSKTMIVAGNREKTDHTIKASFQATEKSLKLQIIKYKTKYEQSQRNLQQKGKQIKNLKDQISELNRQLTQKQYLIQQNNSKSNQITKLEETNKALSRQINQQRNKIIELQRYIEQEKNSNFLQMSRFKEEGQKKDYDFQKSLYEKKEEIKQIMEENQYKLNQINKMKALIQDLQKNLDVKTYEFEKNYTHQKNEHNKMKLNIQQQYSQLNSEIKKLNAKNDELVSYLKKSQEQISKLNKKIDYLQAELLHSQTKYDQQSHFRLQLEEEKKNLKKLEDQLNYKIKALQKDVADKQRQMQETNNQLNDVSTTNKKKLTQLLQKNKAYTARIQELENKSNLLLAQEQKMKRILDMTQKQLKSLQQSQKNIVKTLKVKQDRILQLEKDITDIEGKNSLKDSLTKKETQYKGIQIEKLTQRVAQLQKSYEKERQVAEQRRLQLLKSQNKIKIVQQNNSRLNEQIKDLRVQHIKKEDDWSEKVKELKQNIKSIENRQTENIKSLHSNEIQKLNLRNETSKLEKIVETQTQKNEKLKKRQFQLQNFIKTLQSDIERKNQNIIDLQASFKQLENEFKTLQADKSKTQKISSIINQEKDVAKSDIYKLKKEIQKREQKQEQSINQVKNLKQDLTRWQLKFNSLTKEYEKFKTNMSESIKSSLSVKNSYSTIEMSSTSLDYSRNLSKSKYKSNNDFSGIENGDYKFGEVVENIVKQSQQIIFNLNDEIKKTKRQKELVQKQLNSLSVRSKQSEEELARQLKELNDQLEQITMSHSTQIQEYEDKVFNMQRQAKKKQKALQYLNEHYNELKEIYQNYQTSSSIHQSELNAKINSLKNKIIDYERKDQGNSQTFIHLQQKISSLETENTQLTHQISIISQHLTKKQKLYIQCLDDIQQLTHQLEVTKRTKSDLSAQVLTLKQSLIVERESNKQLLAELKSQEDKCNNLKKFNNDILKEKEAYIKRQAEREQKIYSLQEKIQIYLIQISEKTEQIAQRQRYITENRQTIKVSQSQTSNLNTIINDLKISLEREREKLKERERRITQKQYQIENLNTQLKKNQTKYEGQISHLTQENDSLTTQLSGLKNQSTQKQNELQHQIKKLTQNQKKLNEANIALEQQVFFQKQMNSLTHSQLQDHKMQILQLNSELDNIKNDISNLNDEIRQKEESLFALSGKLYASDYRLQNKEEQFKNRMEKVQMQWRYKIEQICQEYENKIEIIEKQKNYVNTGLQGSSENVQRLQNEKKALLNQIQRQKEAYELKLKRQQEDKLASLLEKNKQIQKLREVFQQLQEKIKRKDFEYKSLDEDKKKVEEKLRDLRAEIEKGEDKKSQVIRNLEKEIDQLKRKEGQLKRFKDALKNNQWATQRQIKKSIQLCGKSVLTLTPEQNKDELMNLMRNLETSITKIALPNIDEL